jgi:hypothetical protein
VQLAVVGYQFSEYQPKIISDNAMCLDDPGAIEVGGILASAALELT